jgi:hypothetical protein
MSDYRQCFREDHCVHGTEIVSSSAEDILAFIEEVANDNAIAGYEKGAQRERAALISHVESLKLEGISDREEYHNDTLNLVLNYLREPEKCNGVCGMCTKCQGVNVSGEPKEKI